MFNKSNFCHIASNNRNDQKGSVFIYKTTDTLAQVTQSGYFNEKLIDINVHDLIIHVQYDPVARTLKKSVLIVTERTMDNVETAPILDQTIGDDIAELGDQVQGIEEKIPENASSKNQLATKNQITDLQNNKQDIATAINYDNISNCITEIPQDIKLELSGGGVVLKAGSKIYTPNGPGVFDEYISTIDFSTGAHLYDDKNLFAAFATGLGCITAPWSASGTIANRPAASKSYQLYYATDENKCYFDDGTWHQCSLPLGLVSRNSTVGYYEINLVFNGFGYIGSSVYSLNNIDGLLSDNRNEDGTLKNTSFKTNAIRFINSGYNDSVEYYGLSGTDFNVSKSYLQQEEKPTSTGTMWYKPSENRMYRINNSGVGGLSRHVVCLKTFRDSNGKITKFEPYSPFMATDYNDFREHAIVEFREPTASNNYRWYRKYSDGWVEQGGFATIPKNQGGISSVVVVNLPVQMRDINYYADYMRLGDPGSTYAYMTYVGTRTTSSIELRAFSTVDTSGDQNVCWRVSGMAA